MPTVRSSGRISGGGGGPGPGRGVPGPRGVYLVHGGVYLLWGGCTWSWGVPSPRGVPGPGGCTWSQGGVPGLGGVPGPGGCTWSRGVYLVPGGVYLVPGGCTWSRGGCTWSGGWTWSRGCTWSGGVPGPGVYLVRYSPHCGQTHACKNITFATSLRTVKIIFCVLLYEPPTRKAAFGETSIICTLDKVDRSKSRNSLQWKKDENG